MAEPRQTVHPRQGLLALAFILLTLLALVAVPVIIQQRVDTLRDRIEASEPARTLVARVQFAVVSEATALEDLPIRGRAFGAAAFDTAYATEVEAVAEMASPIAQLGAEPVQRFAELHTALARWHAVTAARRTPPYLGVGTNLSEREQEARGVVLRAAAAVDQAVLRAARQNRDEIAETERIGLAVTLMLGMLAFLAAGTVAALHARMSRFAAEADARRAQAEAALAEATRATEARARLLRGVTHDVKNPLGAAKGYAELLALGVRAPLAPEQAPLVDGVKRTIERALAIITDLLDVARADGGGLTVVRAPADLAGVVGAAVEDHRAAAETRGHRLTFAPVPAAVLVRTDPLRVRQVLDNLLSNAIKYTPPHGRIAVRLVVAPADASRGEPARAAVRVEDSGPGIPPAQREAVFDEFTRLDDGSAQQGHGLGLAIARRVARLLDGDLTVEEAPGGGAAFSLWLPVSDERAPEDRAPGDRPADGAWAGAPVAGGARG